MPGLVIVALAMTYGVNKFVSVAAQSTAYTLVIVGVVLGLIMWVRTGSVW